LYTFKNGGERIPKLILNLKSERKMSKWDIEIKMETGDGKKSEETPWGEIDRL
jgi:hypothetical protein